MQRAAVLVLMFVAVAVMLVLNSYSAHIKFTERNVGRSTQRRVKVCITMMDNRYSANDFELLKLKTINETVEFIRNNFKNLKFHQLSLAINYLYAIKHGYKVLLSDTTEYAAFLRETGRHYAWLKPNFVLDTMKRHNDDCEWIAFLDSDAYFWMDRHETSLETWFSTSTPHEVSKNYFTMQQRLRSLNGYYSWHMQSEYFIIGLNGMFHSNQEGFPSKFLEKDHDYVCTGAFFVRNSLMGRQMMQEWISGGNGTTDETLRRIYKDYAGRHSWEQRPLNYYILPKHVNGTSVYSFMDFNYRHSNSIRHVWGQFNNERIPRMQKAIDDLLSVY